MSLCDARRRKGIRLFWKDFKMKTRIAIRRFGWTEERDSLLFEDKSYTATRRDRSRYENKWKPSDNGQGDRPGSMDKSEDNSQAVTRIEFSRQQASQLNKASILPSHQTRRFFEERQKSKMDAIRMEHIDKVTFLVLTSFVFDRWESVAHVVDFKKIERINHFFTRVSLTGDGDAFAGDGRCKQHTHLARLHTRKIFRVRGSRSDETQVFALQHFCARHLQKKMTSLACHVSHAT